MKKLVVFALLIALSTILVTSCRSDTESNLITEEANGFSAGIEVPRMPHELSRAEYRLMCGSGNGSSESRQRY